MTQTANERQAALFIHGLPGEVRERVLAGLTPVERDRVLPLLEELASLGIPRQFRFRGLPANESSRGVDPVERIRHIDAMQLLPVLETYSPAVVANLLACADWPWKPAVLDSMTESRRTAIRSVAPHGPISRRVMGSLCGLVLEDMASREVLPQAAVSRWRRVLSWRK